MSDTNKTPETERSNQATGSPDYRASLIENIKMAHEDTLARLDYEAIAEASGQHVETLKTEAKRMLSRMLNNYPNTTATIGGGWHIHLIKTGYGSHRIEMFYPVTWSTGLICNFEKIKEAHDHGLIDDGGEPVFDPPCCPTCLRENGKCDDAPEESSSTNG